VKVEIGAVPGEELPGEMDLSAGAAVPAMDVGLPQESARVVRGAGIERAHGLIGILELCDLRRTQGAGGAAREDHSTVLAPWFRCPGIAWRFAHGQHRFRQRQAAEQARA